MTRSINSSIYCHFCANVASLSPCPTLRQKSSMPLATPRELLPAIDLYLQVPLLLSESLGAALHVLPAAAILLQRDDTRKVGRGEALQLSLRRCVVRRHFLRV